MEDSSLDKALERIPVSVTAGEFDVGAFEKECSPGNLPVNPFTDDRVLEFLEGTDKGPVCFRYRFEGKNRVKIAVRHVMLLNITLGYDKSYELIDEETP